MRDDDDARSPGAPPSAATSPRTDGDASPETVPAVGAPSESDAAAADPAAEEVRDGRAAAQDAEIAALKEVRDRQVAALARCAAENAELTRRLREADARRVAMDVDALERKLSAAAQERDAQAATATRQESHDRHAALIGQCAAKDEAIAALTRQAEAGARQRRAAAAEKKALASQLDEIDALAVGRAAEEEETLTRLGEGLARTLEEVRAAGAAAAARRRGGAARERAAAPSAGPAGTATATARRREVGDTRRGGAPAGRPTTASADATELAAETEEPASQPDEGEASRAPEEGDAAQPPAVARTSPTQGGADPLSPASEDQAELAATQEPTAARDVARGRPGAPVLEESPPEPRQRDEDDTRPKTSTGGEEPSHPENTDADETMAEASEGSKNAPHAKSAMSDTMSSLGADNEAVTAKLEEETWRQERHALRAPNTDTGNDCQGSQRKPKPQAQPKTRQQQTENDGPGAAARPAENAAPGAAAEAARDKRAAGSPGRTADAPRYEATPCDAAEERRTERGPAAPPRRAPAPRDGAARDRVPHGAASATPTRDRHRGAAHGHETATPTKTAARRDGGHGTLSPPPPARPPPQEHARVPAPPPPPSPLRGREHAETDPSRHDDGGHDRYGGESQGTPRGGRPAEEVVTIPAMVDRCPGTAAGGGNRGTSVSSDESLPLPARPVKSGVAKQGNEKKRTLPRPKHPPRSLHNTAAPSAANQQRTPVALPTTGPSRPGESGAAKSGKEKKRTPPRQQNPNQSLHNTSPPSTANALPTTGPSLMHGKYTSVPNDTVASNQKTLLSIPPQVPASRTRTVASNQKTLLSIPPQMQTRKRPAAQTASSGSSASNVTNSPASLSRLYPDPSDLIKAVTRWQPPTARVRNNARGGTPTVDFQGPIRCHYQGLESELHNPWLRPTSPAGGRIEQVREFRDVSDLTAALAYPILNEGLCAMNQESGLEENRGIWKQASHHLKLMRLAQVTPMIRSKSYFREDVKMYEAQFLAQGKHPLPFSNTSDVYCIHFPGWQRCKFGVTAHDFPTTAGFRTYTDGTQVLKLWLVVHPNEQETKQTGWLSPKDLKNILHPQKSGLVVRDNANFTLIQVGSANHIVRQFEAIKSLPHLKPHLQRAIFTSHVKDPSKPATTTKPRSLPVGIWKSLINSYNTDQLSSISRVMTGSCRDNVNLVQGPPGTGKTSTICGLISALLSGQAPLPKQRQHGCLIKSLIQNPGKAKVASEPISRNRILVCAETNQAVDTLVWKIKQTSIGASGMIGDFAMARFGSLPWENRGSHSTNKPKIMSNREACLYEINVNRRVCDKIQELECGRESEETTNRSSQKEGKPPSKKRKKMPSRATLRSEILGSSSIVFATLSGAGSKTFIEAAWRDPDKNDSSEFDAVIIDEACQMSEPEALVPFKYNPTTITLVGDPKQLPVMTMARNPMYKKLHERSLFERLQNLNFPTIFLRNQYRMHQSIAAFPSEQFYEGKLITSDSVKNRQLSSWSSCSCFPVNCFWDINGRHIAANSSNESNTEEANFITETILYNLAHTCLEQSDAPITVGVISFYRHQVNLLQERLSKIPVLNNNSRLNVKVATVDCFQGSECDIIIISCVRSHVRSGRRPGKGGRNSNSIGFLNDFRRVNVALTRAKRSLWIVGNAQVLRSSDLWRTLIKDMDHQKMLRRGYQFKELFEGWKASKQAIESPTTET